MSALTVIALVAKREFATRARTKSFIISNAVLLVLLIAGIIAASVFSGGSDSASKLGLVGAASSLSAPLKTTAESVGTSIDTSTVPDEATAKAEVDSGDLDAALLPHSGGSYTVLVKKEASKSLHVTLTAVVRQQAVDTALSAQGVDPASVAQAAARANVTVDATSPPDPQANQRIGLAYIALFLMFFQIFIFGLYVAMGVVEEKASRVVEVLLATIKPLHLLWGKILGIGAVGLAQLAVFGAAALAAGLGTGLVTVTGTAVGVFAMVLVWFILGFAFYAVIYAAAGSLVSRQEDVNSAATPISIVIFASYFLAQAVVQNPESTLSSVMSWIPPFSAMLMPLRVAAGVTNIVQIVGSAVLMLAVTVALAVLAARIYERSVLHTGAKVGWKEALRTG